MFVVAPSGKLYGLDARGKLDTIIPELLKEKIAAAPVGPAAIGG